MSNQLLEQAQYHLISMGTKASQRLARLEETREQYGLTDSEQAQWHEETDLLRRINKAEKRVQAGQYARCCHCNESIEPERLLLVPYTDSCMACNYRLARNKLQKFNYQHAYEGGI